LCWDVTVICPLAESYVTRSDYANIGSQYLFAPVAVETLGPLNTSACQLFGNLGRKSSSSSGDNREGAFLFQRVSARKGGAAAESAASNKEEKYANTGSQYLFAPIAVKTLGPLNTSACQLFGNLGRR